MSDEFIIRLLRVQAWERAKGELYSMTHSYHTGEGNCRPDQFTEFYTTMEQFIKHVEDNGLQE